MTLATGPDVAKYQTFFDPSRATGPVDFAFEKSSEGLAIHSAFETMWTGVQQVPVRGAYHYQRNGNWQAQADLFLQTTNPKPFHILALDVEGYGNIVDATFLLDSRRIIDYLIANTTRKVLLYTNINYYKQMQALGMNNWLETISLWIAYPSSIPGAPSLPPGRTSWSFHQYSWTGSGARWGTGGATDENVYNGTVDELKQWVGVTVTPPGDPIMKKGILTANTHVLNVRNAPSTVTGTILTTLLPNDWAYGEIDPASGWLKVQYIIRLSGTREDFTAAYCSSNPVYITIFDYIPPVTEDKITVTVTENGVTKTYTITGEVVVS